MPLWLQRLDNPLLVYKECIATHPTDKGAMVNHDCCNAEGLDGCGCYSFCLVGYLGSPPFNCLPCGHQGCTGTYLLTAPHCDNKNAGAAVLLSEGDICSQESGSVSFTLADTGGWVIMFQSSGYTVYGNVVYTPGTSCSGAPGSACSRVAGVLADGRSGCSAIVIPGDGSGFNEGNCL